MQKNTVQTSGLRSAPWDGSYQVDRDGINSADAILFPLTSATRRNH